MRVEKIKSLSQIKREARELLKGNRLKYVGIVILISLIMVVLYNIIPAAGALIGGFVGFIFANLNLSIVDRKGISVDALADFKNRPLEIFLSGIIIYGITIAIFLVAAVPIFIVVFLLVEATEVNYILITIMVVLITILSIAQIFISIKFTFTYNVLFDEDIKGFEAIKKSYDLTKGNFFRIFTLNLIFVLYGILIYIFFLLIFLPLIIIASINDPGVVVNGVLEPSDTFYTYFMVYLFGTLSSTLIIYLIWIMPYYNISMANLYRTIVLEKSEENESPVIYSDEVPFLE